MQTDVLEFSLNLTIYKIHGINTVTRVFVDKRKNYREFNEDFWLNNWTENIPDICILRVNK